MKVFKFGGASVKNAEAVRNVQSILQRYENEPLFIVVSAMGKTTNALERVVEALYRKKYSTFLEEINELHRFHTSVAQELFNNESHPLFDEISIIFEQLRDKKNKTISENYNFLYDQIVSLGEVLSTKIIAAFLSLSIPKIEWVDARNIIRTDNNYRNASIDWEKTTDNINQCTKSSNASIFITQGFIGHTSEGFSTTLGREGSDFTAGIIAFCTNAKSVTIWKDVPGMLNADPKWFDNTVKLDKISYKESIELAYYGASIIHPKTIKPLQNKNIPLYIRSFIEPEADGTVIQSATDNDGVIPSFIFKINQVLISITPKDFSFIVEENLSTIFQKIALAGGHINVMQVSAVSFTAGIDIDAVGMEKLNDLLSEEFLVRYNENLELVTIRHYDDSTIARVTQGKEVLMEQKTRHTVRIVMRNL